MSAVGNGQCREELLYDGKVHYCILPKGHMSSGIPHRTEWTDGHQHNWVDENIQSETKIVAKEGQTVADIGSV